MWVEIASLRAVEQLYEVQNAKVTPWMNENPTADNARRFTAVLGFIRAVRCSNAGVTRRVGRVCERGKGSSRNAAWQKTLAVLVGGAESARTETKAHLIGAWDCFWDIKVEKVRCWCNGRGWWGRTRKRKKRKTMDLGGEAQMQWEKMMWGN